MAEAIRRETSGRSDGNTLLVVMAMAQGTRIQPRCARADDTLTAYLKLGSPAQLSAAQIDALRQLTFNEPELQRLEVALTACATDAAMRKYDVVLVELLAPASAP